MKNTTKKKKARNSPSKLSRWAYMMQAIEPCSAEINEAFPDYHPQWLQTSQVCTVSAESFRLMLILLSLSESQCAAYLRINLGTVQKWQTGEEAVPFAVFELLRVILESVSFKTSHPEWDGWFISKNGVLLSGDCAKNGFTVDQLRWLSSQRVDSSNLKIEVDELKAQLQEAQDENTKLRQMYVSEGVVDELAAMGETISNLMTRIATARVIPFATPAVQLKEKTA